jgi:hypothetical protein
VLQKEMVSNDKLDLIEQLRNGHAAERQALLHELEELQTKLDRVNRSIENLDKYLADYRPDNEKETTGKSSDPAPVAAPPKSRKPRKDRKEVTKRILSLLEKAPKEGYDAAEIRSKLNLSETSAELSAVLRYIKLRGKVSISPANRWTLAQ